jgi:putative N6-adenine-specific DNA methylase
MRHGSKGSIQSARKIVKKPSAGKPAPEAKKTPRTNNKPERPADGRCDFFLIATPGFEDLVAEELAAWLPQAGLNSEVKIEGGGVSFRAELELGLSLNCLLKTPTRILLRLADFGCRDFPKLFRKISNFPWEEWVSDSATIAFSASSRESWLKIKKRIEQTCDEGRKARQKTRSNTPSQNNLDRNNEVDVLVRFDKDICYISLDTSGELLHKRGYRPMSSEAPLRETTAAALLLLMKKVVPSEVKVDLVDPMTGGGTFLLEAALLAQPVRTRQFAYESFVKTKKVEVAPATTANRFIKLIGFDSDAKALQAAKENFSRAKIDMPFELLNADFFVAQPLTGETPRWLICNPPYGERISVEGPLSEFYAKLFEATERVVRPQAACFILPEKAGPDRVRTPKAWRILEKRRFLNGGLPVIAVVYGRR